MIYSAIVFLPALGAAHRGPVRPPARRRVRRELITTGFLLVSCVLSWVVFIASASGTRRRTSPSSAFITSGEFDIDWAFRIDTLSAVMLVVVTTVSSLVHVYSWGYMDEDDPARASSPTCRCFTFAMLMLVTADNFMQLFFGWEGVGLVSLPADRLLVQQARGQRGGDQGLRRQPRRRLRLRARHHRAVLRCSAPSTSTSCSTPRPAWPARASSSSATRSTS